LLGAGGLKGFIEGFIYSKLEKWKWRLGLGTTSNIENNISYKTIEIQKR